MARTATIDRKTGETNVHLTFNVDGSGKSEIDTGIGFLDHMLTLFAAHGLFDLVGGVLLLLVSTVSAREKLSLRPILVDGQVLDDAQKEAIDTFLGEVYNIVST